MNARRFLIAAVLALLPASALAQSCDHEEARQLDFWLGEWDLTWEGGEGTNSITRRFGDCVIEENFAGNLPGGLLEGHSVSVYDAPLGKWQQTWVDNQGGYLTFTGGVGEDGVMRLYGPERTLADGRIVVTRMSWVDVTRTAMDWHWERSFDGGENWEMVWLIHYARR